MSDLTDAPMTDPGNGPTSGPGVFDVCGPLPTGTVLLEASAGTGKTWTIAALVTRFVAEGHVRLEEMLVVTFGRAASQELRDRVRAQLVAAERALAAGQPPPPPAGAPPDALLALLLDADPDEVRARRERLREALADFDAATIATTHQFCQLVLRGLGVAGDIDSGSTLVEDLDDLVVEVADDLYVRGFAHADGPPLFDRKTALRIARTAVGDPQARLEPVGAEPGSPAARRRGFAEAVRRELDLRKRRLGLLGYDDLLSRLADALSDPAAPARQRMRDRWRVVLVDEFQDTDPVQWKVLDRAFSGQATMVLIGDPKQAIYAFRGGDVTTYLQAAGSATTQATLGTNHRSDEALLTSVQSLLNGAELGDPRIAVRPVVAAHRGRRLVGTPVEAPFRLRMVPRSLFPGSNAKGVSIAVLRELVAADLAGDVADLLASGATFAGDPLKAGDVAVLCETRRQCATVKAALELQGIPAVLAGGSGVFGTRGADEWLSLLEAMEQPHRSGRVRAAALTSFFGRTPAELDAGGDALTTEVAETLRDWALLLRRRGVAAVFETAATSHGLAARVLAEVDGERLLTDLRHVAESLHDAATREQLALVAQLAWLRDRIARNQAETSGERSRRLDSDAAAVQVLTVHGSKGLQFPVVYLPFLCDLFPRTPDFPLFHDDAGERCLDVGGSPARPHLDRSRDERAGEDLRLLYVALTRAQSQLVTWWLPSARNTTTSSLHRMLMGRVPRQGPVPAEVRLPDDASALDHARKWQEVGAAAVEVTERREVARADLPTDRAPLAVRPWTRQVDQVWRRTSYSALTSAAANEPVLTLASEPEDPVRDDEPDEPDPLPTGAAGTVEQVPSPLADLPVGATFGSLVHAVLEHADPAAPEHGGDLRAELLAHIREQLVRWPVDLDPEVLADGLVAVHDAPLGPLAPGLTLGQLSRSDRMCELDFELPLAGGDVTGHPRSRARLADLAPILRRHLPAGDPLLPYADVLSARGPEASWVEQQLHGYLTGSVDVVLRAGGRYLVVDYKTNWLGPTDEPLTTAAYTPQRLAAAMTHSSYPLQALLYAVVLHRFLRWRLVGYDPEQHLGGVLYLYLRGMAGAHTPVIDGQPCGVFSWRPPVDLVEEISDLLDGVEVASA